jgi:hypothetical protein
VTGATARERQHRLLLKRKGHHESLSPAQITANTNDYAPAGLAYAETLYLNTDAARDITGITGGDTDRFLHVINNGSFNMTLRDASVSSTAANRFSFGRDVVMRPKQGVGLVYSAASSRWFLLSDTLMWASVTDLPEILTVSGISTPAQITANQNDYAVSAIATVLRMSTDASRNMTGIAGGVSGRILKLINVGTNPLVLKNADATSTAANRFDMGADVTLAAKQAINLWYDTTDSRWKSTGNTAGAAVAASAVTAATLAASAVAAFTIINGYLDWTVAGNALTCALKTLAGTDPTAGDPVWISLRGATVTDGKPDVFTVTAALSATLSSGSSAGTSNNVPFKLHAVFFDDVGTARIGLVNVLSGTNLMPLAGWGIASSTAEGGAGAADSPQVIYTGTAVGAKGYAYLGYASWETGLAAAGTWSAGPTRKQLFGPNVRLPGDTIQLQGNETGAVAAGATLTPLDDTIPQITEGDQYMSQAITPTSAANLLAIEALFMGNSNNASAVVIVALHQDAIANALAVTYAQMPLAAGRMIIPLSKVMLAGITVATIFRIRAGQIVAGSLTFNGTGGIRELGGGLTSYLRVREIAA